MHPNKLTTLLNELHGRPACGGLSQAASERMWARVSKAMVSQPTARVSLISRAMVLPRLFADAVARPAMISILIMVLALGGWIGGVNASLTTVPGDMLYGIKLASEKAQLSLAGDGSRQKLQAEFATRRVREVAELVKRKDEPMVKQEKVKVAVDGFKKHMSGLKENTATQSEASVVEVARVVEEKEAEMKEVLVKVQEDAVSEGTVATETSVETAISEGVEIATEAKEEVVENLVARVEEGKEEETKLSSDELERQIKNALRAVSADSQLLLTRIDRVEKALSARGLKEDVLDVRQARYAVRSQLEPTSKAMDIAARGSYREALEQIANITSELDKVKDVLTDAELKLVQMAQEEVVPSLIEKVDDQEKITMPN